MGGGVGGYRVTLNLGEGHSDSAFIATARQLYCMPYIAVTAAEHVTKDMTCVLCILYAEPR